MRRRPIAISLTIVAALGLLAAGCGSSGGGYGGGGSTAAETTAPSAPASTGAVLTAAPVPKLGKVIVDQKGLTLYDFDKDKGTTSSCYGPCEAAWPPLRTEGAPQAGEGVSASKLGTTERKDGTTQVTLAGHPVYTFVEDKKPGEANGNDTSAFGGKWHAVLPSGEEAGG